MRNFHDKHEQKAFKNPGQSIPFDGAGYKGLFHLVGTHMMEVQTDGEASWLHIYVVDNHGRFSYQIFFGEDESPYKRCKDVESAIEYGKQYIAEHYREHNNV